MLNRLMISDAVGNPRRKNRNRAHVSGVVGEPRPSCVFPLARDGTLLVGDAALVGALVGIDGGGREAPLGFFASNRFNAP